MGATAIVVFGPSMRSSSNGRTCSPLETLLDAYCVCARYMSRWCQVDVCSTNRIAARYPAGGAEALFGGQ
jgi:hypothetical protein